MKIADTSLKYNYFNRLLWFYIHFGFSSIASLTLKQEFEVGSLLGINIPYCLWKKNPMFNISRSTHIKTPIFGMHMDIFTNSRLSRKKLQLEPLGEKYSDLTEEFAPKIMSSSFLKSTSGFAQTTKSISGRRKY